VLATAARIYDEKIKAGEYSFVAKSPINTTNIMRILLPAKPVLYSIKDREGKVLKNATYDWDVQSKTCRIVFENSPEGIAVSIKY
jgi:cell division protein YceG involved in septum cleavage